MKHYLFSAYYCLLLAGGALMTNACTDIDPKLTNDYLPLLPEESGVTTQLDYGDLYAFPGAEGHGRNVTGGRGGKVYHVTSLADDGSEGTFRKAVEASGVRTIVFDVAGTIWLTKSLSLKNDNVTIAGQTSPGGICIAGYPFSISANNAIVRFLRFRPGNINEDSDGLGGMDKKNVIVDHCSISWGTDETLSVYAMTNATVQWCLAYQALRVTPAKGGTQTHGFGGNWGGDHISYHHNMIAHCESRVPRLGPRYTIDEEAVDIRNNVYYNWAGEGCYGGEAQHVNIVNNYYKPGPATDKASAQVKYRIAKIGVRTNEYVETYPDYKPWLHQWGTFFIDGNYMFGNADVTNDNWTDGVYAQQEAGTSNDNLWSEQVMKDIKKDEMVVKAGSVTTHSSEEAYAKVLEYVGACNYRDAADELIIKDVKEATATCLAQTYPDGYNQRDNKPGYINDPIDMKNVLGADADEKGYPNLTLDSSIDVTDTDGDGIPDSWETEHGLDPNYAYDGNMKTIDVHEQYTNLEMYMNSLVKDIMDKCRENGQVVE